MAIDKVKFPNGNTENIQDSRIPGVDSTPTANSANLVTSGGVKSALSGYLPLTGGTLNSGSSSPTLTLNTSAADSAIKILQGGSDSAWIGYSASAGVYLYNCARSRYLSYKNDGSLLFENNKVWHEGNDGAGSGLDADLLDGHHNGDLYANGLRDFNNGNNPARRTAGNIEYMDGGLHYHLATSSMTDSGRPGGDGKIIALGWDNNGHWNSQLYIASSDVAATLAGGHMKLRHQNGSASSWGDWLSVAMTDSNVASATKLETARKLWGQNFDGSADVSGDITLTVGANASIGSAYTVGNPNKYNFITFGNATEGLTYTSGSWTSNADVEAHRFYVGDPSTLAMTIKNSGNVGINTPSPAYKLDVAGDIRGTSVTTTLQTSQPSGGMLPNREYKLGTLSSATTFTLAAETSGVTNHYFWTFETGSTAPTITWPAAITSWAGGSAPSINSNRHYEVSVLNGVAVVLEV